jgi:CHU_C Type IX secretion signal domain
VQQKSFPLIWFVVAVFCSVTDLTAQITADLSVAHARCYGLRGKLTVLNIQGGTAPFYFSLDSVSYSTNPTLPTLAAGDYTLFIRDDFGHKGVMPFTIGQPPQLSVEIIASAFTVAPNDSFILEVKVTPSTAVIESIKWRPQNIFPENINTGQPVTILQNTTFAVEVRDTNNCLATDQQEVRVHNSDLYFPNVIASRSTTNEVFTLYGASEVQIIKQMTIIDRYGKVMFYKTDMIPNDTQNGWNGRHKDKPVLPGVYFYECELEFLGGKREVFKGDVTVLN